MVLQVVGADSGCEEVADGGRIGFRDRGKLGPGQIGLDQRDVRRAHSSIFGIAAIANQPEVNQLTLISC
jgi:hypothetical protein